MLPDRIPEFKRRALRLALGVFIPSYIGFAILEEGPMSAAAATVAKWAAISATVVAQPIIGKASQVGGERILGTILGGFIGFVVHSLGAFVFFSEYEDGVYLAISAAVFAGLSIIIGNKYKLETSARLFTITLLLVTFAGDAGQATWYIAFVRVAGILLGVLLMLLLSVVVMPKSATVECLHCIDRSLKALHQLHSLIFHDIVTLPLIDMIPPPTTKSNLLLAPRTTTTFDNNNNSSLPSVSSLPAAAAAPPSPPLSIHRSNNNYDYEDASLPLLAHSPALHSIDVPAAIRVDAGFVDPGARHEELCDTALSQVYSALFDLQTSIGQAKSEVLVGVANGRLILAPRMPLSKTPMYHLPWEGLSATSLSIRKIARTLFTLGNALDSGDASAVRRYLPSTGTVLHDVAHAGHDVLYSLRESFPLHETISSRYILRYMKVVEKWEESGTDAMREHLRSSRRYQLLLLAWDELVDAVKRNSMGTNTSSNTSGNTSSNTSGNTSSISGRSPHSLSVDSPPPPQITTIAAAAAAVTAEANKGKMKSNEIKHDSIDTSAFLEWQALAFLMRQLGMDFVTLHYQLLGVMRNLPYHKH